MELHGNCDLKKNIQNRNRKLMGYREFRVRLPQTKIISTEKSGHYIQLDEAELVIDAIRTMVEKVK